MAKIMAYNSTYKRHRDNRGAKQNSFEDAIKTSINSITRESPEFPFVGLLVLILIQDIIGECQKIVKLSIVDQFNIFIVTIFGV